MRIAILLFFFLSTLFTFGQTESYYVIHLKGTIKNVTTGKPVKMGDKLNASDKIQYNPLNSSAVVISTVKGRFVISKPANENVSATGEFLSLVKNTMLPLKSNGQLSTRGESEIVTNLKDVLGSETFVFPDDAAKFILSPSVYPMNGSQCLVYSYKYQGKTVSKKIGFSKDTLTIRKKDLYVVNGNPIIADEVTSVDIYKFNQATKENSKVTTFKPVFVEESALTEEFGILIKLYKDQKMSKEQIVDQLSEHLSIVYGGENGKTDKQMLSIWLKEKFKL